MHCNIECIDWQTKFEFLYINLNCNLKSWCWLLKIFFCLPPFFCHFLNRICWWITDRESFTSAAAPSYPSPPFIWMLGFTGRFILSLSIQLPSDPRALSCTPVYWTSYILQATMSIPLSVTAQEWDHRNARLDFYKSTLRKSWCFYLSGFYLCIVFRQKHIFING